jgi:hypothetical protein
VLEQKEPPSFSPRLVNQAGVEGVQWLKECVWALQQLHPDLDKYSIYHLAGAQASN